jgi:multifunctional beta-oxidation protein
VTAIVHTTDKTTGNVIFENQTTLVIRGSGGFGGKRVGRGQLRHVWHEAEAEQMLRIFVTIDRGTASATNTPPNRKPDVILEEKTLPSQAALYRCVHSLHFHSGYPPYPYVA